MPDLTIDDCFAEIIKDKGWYHGSQYNRKMASKHKMLFLVGKLPYEIKKSYLESLGYKITQPEVWKKEI